MKSRTIDQKTVSEIVMPGDKDKILEALAGRLRSNFQSIEVLQSCYELCAQLARDPGRYDTIISDDASGRLVSLLVKSVLDRTRERKGLKPLNLRFVAGGINRSDQKIAIREYLAKHHSEFGRILLVTEIVDTGDSMRNLLRLFADFKLSPDVASVSIAKLPDKYHVLFSNKLIYGSLGYAGGNLYGFDSRRQAGVDKKSTASSAHPASLRATELRGGNQRVAQQIQSSVNQTRKEINLISAVFLRLMDSERV